MSINFDEYAYNHEKNILAFQFESSQGKTIVSYPPRSIWIEITTNCSLKCKFCGHPNMKRTGGEMSFDNFKRIIDDIKDYLDKYGDRDMTEVSFTRYGEPLIHSDLGKMIKYANEANIYTYLPTNGTVMAKSKRDMILNSNLNKMNISVDIINDDRHIELMGIPIKKRMKNILNFFKEKFELKQSLPIVEVSMVKYDGYENEQKLFESFFRLISVDRINMGDCFNLVGTVDVPFNEEDKILPCFAPWYTFGIYWNGDCNFCLQDPEGNETLLGNIFESSLEEIWNSPRAQSVRKSVWNFNYKDYHPCSICNVNVYDRYQVKPFMEQFINYSNRMQSIKPKKINIDDYIYLSHLQSIQSGTMTKRDWDRSLTIINEVLERLESDDRFYDILSDIVSRYIEKGGTVEKLRN